MIEYIIFGSGFIVGVLALWAKVLLSDSACCSILRGKIDELGDLLDDAHKEIKHLRNYISDIEKSHKGGK